MPFTFGPANHGLFAPSHWRGLVADSLGVSIRMSWTGARSRELAMTGLTAARDAARDLKDGMLSFC
jgi:hypothetical protein